MSEEEEMTMPLIDALVFCKNNPEYEFNYSFGEEYFSAYEWLESCGTLTVLEVLDASRFNRKVRKREPQSHKEVKQVLEKYLRPPCKIDEAFEKLKPYLKGE